MTLAIKRPGGTVERIRHVPFKLRATGSRVEAYHKTTGRLLGRFNSEALALAALRTMTERV